MTGDSKKADTRHVFQTNSKYNDNIRDGRKGIIEEWKNPPILVEDILRSDQLYEERAIDVGFECHPRQSQHTPINVESNKENVIKIKRPQGGGTVRSIPIKDYQASLAHNVGTLRKSIVPQTQFESLVSEPEKIVTASGKRRPSLANDFFVLAQTNKHATLSTASRNKELPANAESRDLMCKACNHCHYVIQGDSHNRTAAVNFSSKFDNDDLHDVGDWDQYFRRTSSRKLGSNNRGVRNSKRQNEFRCNNAESTMYNRIENAEGDATKRSDAIDVECSNVGQKIFVYEENARRAKRDRDARRRSLSDMRKHRTIGVPLVGMHNACGLPVVASWHDPDILEPLRVTSKIVGTLGPVYKGPRVYSTARRRMHPKGRAPQPDRATCRVRTKVQKSSISGETIEKSSRKKTRRPSFKTTRAATLSVKNSLKRGSNAERKFNRGSSLDNFGKKSVKEETRKRSTLYAKDDGEEAVEVLKSLCLNPLARSKAESDMMW